MPSFGPKNNIFEVKHSKSLSRDESGSFQFSGLIYEQKYDIPATSSYRLFFPCFCTRSVVYYHIQKIKSYF